MPDTIICYELLNLFTCVAYSSICCQCFWHSIVFIQPAKWLTCILSSISCVNSWPSFVSVTKHLISLVVELAVVHYHMLEGVQYCIFTRYWWMLWPACCCPVTWPAPSPILLYILAESWPVNHLGCPEQHLGEHCAVPPELPVAGRLVQSTHPPALGCCPVAQAWP